VNDTTTPCYNEPTERAIIAAVDLKAEKLSKLASNSSGIGLPQAFIPLFLCTAGASTC
jgi:hypothetical protein